MCRMEIPFLFITQNSVFRVNFCSSFLSLDLFRRSLPFNDSCCSFYLPVFYVARSWLSWKTHYPYARGKLALARVFSPLNQPENLWAIWPSTTFKRRCFMEPSSRVSLPSILSKVLSVNPLGSHSHTYRSHIFIGLIARF